ncbi:hypothetical protein [Levilactobacillus wangkuiensis]|nr:hypothetical protein [Levilactobacillus wangkuiensis]
MNSEEQAWTYAVHKHGFNTSKAGADTYYEHVRYIVSKGMAPRM